MADTPSHVQVAADGVGKLIDAQSLTTPEDNVSTVQRQTIVLGDPAAYLNLAQIDVNGQQYVRVDLLMEPLHNILTELRLLRLTLSTIGDVFIDEEK